MTIVDVSYEQRSNENNLPRTMETTLSCKSDIRRLGHTYRDRMNNSYTTSPKYAREDVLICSGLIDALGDMSSNSIDGSLASNSWSFDDDAVAIVGKGEDEVSDTLLMTSSLFMSLEPTLASCRREQLLVVDPSNNTG